MGCLTDILCGNKLVIGIRGFKDCEEPESNLFINDLEGMSLKTSAAIADGEKQSGYNLLQEKINFATRLVFEEFKQVILPTFKFNEVVSGLRAGEFNSTYHAVNASERGLYVERYNARLAKIMVKTLYLRSNTTATKTVKIIDGIHTEEIEVDLVAGEIVTVNVNYKADHEDITIVMDNSDVEVSDGSLEQLADSCGCGCTSCCDYLTVRGWNGTQRDSNMYGINADITLECDEEELICMILDRMYFIILYKSGIEIIKEFLASNRLNNVTLFTKDRAQELLERWEDEYKVKFKVFEKGVKIFLNSFNDLCITCNGLHYEQSLP